ncbi:hypothetical protein L1987_15526 [Smallanthus sonchifolius]|uniref:Uncharacterized protein n=1 Tax=Smallanthus sonchifolius TaxID=185202 RepID=A0ACB9J5U3_9ASTR|nr:hypothetical protein L1987_15526 [Smallanthus sonchifolius]
MAMRRMAVKGEGNKKCVLRTTGDNPTTMNLIGNMETPPPLPPVYGTTSVIGRQRQMLDEVSVRTNLCRPEINGFQPVHFFGVFDGQLSVLCKEHMHVIIKEELMRVKVVGDGGDELWRLAVNRSFQRMDEMALKRCCSSLICRCNPQLSLMGSMAVVSIVTKECMVVANCGDSRAVLCREGRPMPLSDNHKDVYLRTSIVTKECMVVANCGDSRVVLCLEGWPIQLSDNNKADEGGCGGRIVSRPIGYLLLFITQVKNVNLLYHKRLRSISRSSLITWCFNLYEDDICFWATSEPEISITKREARDECLILGSNGVWDVVSSESACKTVHDCLDISSVEPRIEGRASAATILVRLALGRRSSDNISAIVIDLRK